MFARLGSFAVRFRWFILAAWILVAIVVTIFAPNINSVAVSDQSAFLPSSAPSLDANAVVKKYFPDRVSPSSAVVVVDAGTGNQVDQGAAAQFVGDLTAWLTGADKPAGVDKVWSPTYGDEQTKASLTSPDKQVALVLARFTAVGTEQSTKDAITAIQGELAKAPTGVTVNLTGDGPILAAYNTASQKSMASTTWITILLVVAILLLIYRSPVSPVIPLATIGLAYVISRGVVAFLGSGPLTISMYTNVFLIVVLFGAGTDYCLFLISRFREEMSDVHAAAPAVKTTVRTIGETISSSAGTVIVGLAMMALAELGLYNTTGPSIAIGVAIALLAGLTFTPALLTILGHYAFWPRKPKHIGERGIWHAWAGKVVGRPIIALLVPIIILVPLAVYGAGLARDFDLLGDLPKTDQTRMGFDVLAAHFGPGQMQPLNIVAVDSARFDTPQGLANAQKLQALLKTMPHVTAVRSFTGSLDQKTLSVADQLGTEAKAVRDGIAQLQAGLSGGDTSQIQTAAAGLTKVYGYLAQLAQGYPDVAADPGYQKATGALTELAKLASALQPASGGAGATGTVSAAEAAALTQLQDLATGLESLQQTFTARPDAIMLPELYLSSNAGLKALRDAYLSTDGTAVRVQVVLDSGPYSPEAIDATKVMRTSLSAAGFDAAVEGDSAVLLDLQQASNRDMTRAMIYVLGGIFIVLILLLRALVSPIYLILTILLSYSATMGVVRLVFVDVLGNAGIVWWVPMFMFVMLVALGMDYNIFLIGRVKEEVAAHGTRAGTRQALARTGGIITSAGIIMAGTFASMISGSLLGLLQIGFAVAFGVLLDTFIVRTTLVPAITVLLGRWSWWPRRGPGGKPIPAGSRIEAADVAQVRTADAAAALVAQSGDAASPDATEAAGGGS
jgi:putative drug exporter of the RND superfamily